MIARVRKIVKQVQVAFLRDASALLALVNIELPLAAIPPIPSPFGLWRSTRKISITPKEIQAQERIEFSVIVSIDFCLS